MNTRYYHSEEAAISDLISLLTDSDSIAMPQDSVEEGEFKTIALDSPKKPLSSIEADLRVLDHSTSLPLSLQYQSLLADNRQKLTDLIVNGYESKETIDDQDLSLLLRAIVHLGALDQGRWNSELLYLYSARDPAKNVLTTLLIENNANVNVYAKRLETKITPLLVCLFFNPDPELIQLMLDHGAEDEDFHAIKIALTHCPPAVCKLLLKQQKNSIDEFKKILLDEKDILEIRVPTIAGFHALQKKDKLKKNFLEAVTLLEQEGESFRWRRVVETHQTMRHMQALLGHASKTIGGLIPASLSRRDTQIDPSSTSSRDLPVGQGESALKQEQSKLSRIGSTIGSTLFSLFAPPPILIKADKTIKPSPINGLYTPTSSPLAEIR